MIKRALHNAPKQARLLAYTSLCRLHMKYAASVRDPSLADNIEMVQHHVISFISQIKGRERITEVRKKLELETLAHKKAKIRHTLLLRKVSKKDNHQSLSSAYNELLSNKPNNASLIKAITRGLPPTISAKISIY